MSFVDVKSLVNPFTPNFSCGVDAEGTRGGLAVFSWYDGYFSCIALTPNYILCNLKEVNESSRNILFLYEEPKIEERSRVWDELSTFLSLTPNCLLIGDFNQVDSLQDKLGGSLSIRGLGDFMDWRLENELMDIPFSGPRFTWTNKRISGGLIMERLDKALCTNNWFVEFPDGRVFHKPIIVSDHAAVLYDLEPSIPKANRPYQLERWCLRFSEIKVLTSDTWMRKING
ncbi:uncharacterized protein LOC110710935 [Chenopodium quinoa]|uniref:uncharacterized protein LOC110710935 n=1 Tax=Chenopodium quinoa TaxID=63459 RepID=UPI000B78E49D|nr:uncharacterized protein LOC110710935 [Chenopodium quinoa]